MRSLSLDVSKLEGFINENEIGYMKAMVNSAHEVIHNGTGAGNDFLGWVDLPVNYDKDEFDRIKKAAEKIREDSEVLLVIGIGGSISEQERQSNFSDTLLRTLYQKK